MKFGANISKMSHYTLVKFEFFGKLIRRKLKIVSISSYGPKFVYFDGSSSQEASLTFGANQT